MTDKLKPCPFCESNHVERLFNSFGSIILVRCHSCGAYRQSVSQWNHRPLEKALAESEKRAEALENTKDEQWANLWKRAAKRQYDRAELLLLWWLPLRTDDDTEKMCKKLLSDLASLQTEVDRLKAELLEANKT